MTEAQLMRMSELQLIALIEKNDPETITPKGFQSNDVPELSGEDAFLMDLAQEQINKTVNTKTGAPAGIRAQVAAAPSTEDKLATIKKFYPDAMPVEVFDPVGGAANFGKGNFIITNPETGELGLFDEDARLFGIPIPTFGDIADIGPEIAEGVGSMVGGTLAATAAAAATSPTIFGTIPAATAAFVAGEGIGSATAKEAYIRTLELFGETEDTRNVSEVFSDFSNTAIINAAAGPISSKIFQGVKLVAGAPIRFKNKVMSAPAKETFDRLQRSGVTAPSVGMVTGSPLANAFESVLSALPPSTSIMMQSVAQTVDELQKRNAELARQFGGVATTSEAAEKVLGSAKAARVRYDKKRNAMYDEVKDALKDSPVRSNANETQKYADELVIQGATASGKDDVRLAINEAQKALSDAAEGKLDYNTLKNLRTSVRKKQKSAKRTGTSNRSTDLLKPLEAALTKDLYDLVESASSPQLDIFGDTIEGVGKDVLEKYQAANAFVLKNEADGGEIKFIDSVIKKGADEFSAALSYAVDKTKVGGERIQKLRSQFTPEEFDVLAGYELGRMGMPKSGAQTSVGVGVMGDDAVQEAGFSLQTYLTNWSNLSPEAKEAFFGGTRYEKLAPALQDLRFSINRVRDSQAQLANPSGSGRLAAAMGVFGMLGADAAGYLPGEGFEFGFGALATSAGSAKLMTNPSFVKWLAGGVEKIAYDPMSFGQHVRRLAVISKENPDIAEEIEAILMGMSQETLEPLKWQDSEVLKESVTEGIPENNEVSFRQAVPRSVADKLLPTREELMSQMSSIDVPDVGAPMFEPLPSMGSGSFSGQLSMSPTILPNDADRELAARLQQPSAGIAGLI